MTSNPSSSPTASPSTATPAGNNTVSVCLQVFLIQRQIPTVIFEARTEGRDVDSVPASTARRILSMSKPRTAASLVSEGILPLSGVIEKVSKNKDRPVYEIVLSTPLLDVAFRRRGVVEWFHTAGLLTLNVSNETSFQLLMDHPVVLQAALAIALEKSMNITSYYFHLHGRVWMDRAATRLVADGMATFAKSTRPVEPIDELLKNFLEHRGRLGSLSGILKENALPTDQGSPGKPSLRDRVHARLEQWRGLSSSECCATPPPLPKLISTADMSLICQQYETEEAALRHELVEQEEGAAERRETFHRSFLSKVFSSVWSYWCSPREVPRERTIVARHERQMLIMTTMNMISEELVQGEASTDFLTTVMGAVWSMCAPYWARHSSSDSSDRFASLPPPSATSATVMPRSRANTTFEGGSRSHMAPLVDNISSLLHVHRQILIVTEKADLAKRMMFLCSFLFLRNPAESERHACHLLSQLVTDGLNFPCAIAGRPTTNPYAFSLPVVWVNKPLTNDMTTRMCESYRLGPTLETVVINPDTKTVLRIKARQSLMPTEDRSEVPDSPAAVWLNGTPGPDIKTILPDHNTNSHNKNNNGNPPQHYHQRTVTNMEGFATEKFDTTQLVPYVKYTAFTLTKDQLEVKNLSYRSAYLRSAILKAFDVASTAEMQSGFKDEASFKAARQILEDLDKWHRQARLSVHISSLSPTTTKKEPSLSTLSATNGVSHSHTASMQSSQIKRTINSNSNGNAMQSTSSGSSAATTTSGAVLSGRSSSEKSIAELLLPSVPKDDGFCTLMSEFQEAHRIELASRSGSCVLQR